MEKLEYTMEPKPLGTAGPIRNALDRLDAEFLLLYGDSYLPINYSEFGSFTQVL
jgi:NDP-sugar pyrophosphorylase family protein